jgi:hypothetical protein
MPAQKIEGYSENSVGHNPTFKMAFEYLAEH